MRDPNKKWQDSRFTDAELEAMTDEEAIEKKLTHSERSRRSLIKACGGKTMKEALSETPQGRNAIRDLERRESCPWCHPDKEGKYTGAQFKKADESEAMIIFYNGAQATVRLSRKGQTDDILSHDIYYCPMCGRKLRKHKDDEPTEAEDE